MKKIVEKSPDGASQKSKKKARKSVDMFGKTASAGRTSNANDSVMEGLSVSAI
jgi:hypothetical protein